MAAVHDLHAAEPLNTRAAVQHAAEPQFVDDEDNAVVVGHEPFRGLLERIANAAIDLSRNAQK